MPLQVRIHSFHQFLLILSQAQATHLYPLKENYIFDNFLHHNNRKLHSQVYVEISDVISQLQLQS